MKTMARGTARIKRFESKYFPAKPAQILSESELKVDESYPHESVFVSSKAKSLFLQ